MRSKKMPLSARPKVQVKPSGRSVIPPAELVRPDRRKDILVSAERLFAERGYDGVSVRDIATAAGVPIALVGYYFGKKQQLFSTIFEHRKAYIAERIDRMRAIDCSSRNPDAVEDLVRAWAEPFIALRSSEAGEAFVLLVARTAWDPGPEATEVITRNYDGLARIFIERMTQALGGPAAKRIIWGYEYALGALLMYVADKRVERLSDGTLESGAPAYLEDFVQFIGAAFRTMRGDPKPRKASLPVIKK